MREHNQALGWVTRHAPANQIRPVIEAVNTGNETSTDLYEYVMSLAWPIRALHETGNSNMIPPLLLPATQMAPGVSPVASRAESISLLIHAVLPAGLTLATPLTSMLMSHCNHAHWRAIRALINASLLVNQYDRQCALEIANTIPNRHKRISTLKRIDNRESIAPRPFFW